MSKVLEIAEARAPAVAQARAPAVASEPGVWRVVARRKNSLVFLDPEKIWAFEAASRLTFVHSPDGRLSIDLSLAAIETSFGRALFRVHRNWLVNLDYVRELERVIGGAVVVVGNDLASPGMSIRAPIAQHRAKALRDVLLKNATGLRRPEGTSCRRTSSPRPRSASPLPSPRSGTRW
jgi:DNA-binding LytR/AlgR family response regulator